VFQQNATNDESAETRAFQPIVFLNENNPLTPFSEFQQTSRTASEESVASDVATEEMIPADYFEWNATMCAKQHRVFIHVFV
jgi:hypothetical protein